MDAYRLPCDADVSRYTSVTDADRAEMLAAIGVGSIDELFADIPPELRSARPLALDRGPLRTGGLREIRAMSSRNVSTDDEITFLGAGMYDNYVPAIVEAITGRSEFLTPYTPYQPEISQGGLQAMFEYQTAICELTGLPVSNASVYEGPSAVAGGRLPREARQRSPPVHRLQGRAPSRDRDAADTRPRVRDGRRAGRARSTG